MNKMLIQKLHNMELNGCIVQLMHHRIPVNDRQPARDKNIKPKGGKTVCRCIVPRELLPEHGGTMPQNVFGEARCSSTETFCRTCGADKAARRMLRSLHELRGRAFVKRVTSPPSPSVLSKKVPAASTAASS